MTGLPATPDFWSSDATWIATDPNRAKDADGLAQFAEGHAKTMELLYFQTSGSEGEAKWVGLSRAAFLTSAAAVNDHLQSTATDRWLIALPLHHVGGFSILARCHVSGATFGRMTGKWNAQEFLRHCAEEAITLCALVPTQVYDLVKAGLRAPSSMRAIVVGGGGLSVPLGLEARELGWPVLQSFGMTEACSQIATEPLDHLGRGFDPDCLQVLPHWDVKVGGDDKLIVRGAALASGYASQRGGRWSWEPLDNQSGLETRDRVRLWHRDSRTFLRFLGRDSAFVKVKGELVSILNVQRKVDEIAHRCGVLSPLLVCAVPDDRSDSQLVLVAQTGTLDEALMAEILALHSRDCGPGEFIRMTCMLEELPQSGPGKINMTKLCEWVQRKLSSG